LLHAIVHSAGVQDRDGGTSLLATLFGQFPFLEKLFADSTYQGPIFDRGRSSRPESQFSERRANAAYRLRKSVSVTYRTGLGHAETEIGKWRAETGLTKPLVRT
jgi:hypothetical protein